jgi:hypothetical protein
MELMGRAVKDKITGITGIVTGYCIYISGCSQVCVQPPVKKDGTQVDGVWLDEQRVDVIKGQRRVVLDNSRASGFGTPAPVR